MPLSSYNTFLMELRVLLSSRCSLEELHELAQDIFRDYQVIPHHEDRAQYARGLVHLLDQTNQVNDAVELLRQRRSDLSPFLTSTPHSSGRHYVLSEDDLLLQKTRDLLFGKHYGEVTQILEPEIARADLHPKLRIFWVLAKLAGRNPNALSNEKLLRKMQDQLVLAASDCKTRPFALVVLAVINCDYFDLNGLGYNMPSPNVIAEQISRGALVSEEQFLIEALLPSKEVKQKFPQVRWSNLL